MLLDLRTIATFIAEVSIKFSCPLRATKFDTDRY